MTSAYGCHAWLERIHKQIDRGEVEGEHPANQWKKKNNFNLSLYWKITKGYNHKCGTQEVTWTEILESSEMK